jgi:probable O-glycosylation ligase (exosortase A-associated)
VYGPASGIIEGNNELAVALVILIPLMYYLMSTAKKKWVKYGMIFAMVSCGFSIFGSHSRGAFLAIIAMATMLALKSRRPALMLMLGVMALTVMFAFMPDKWTTRMATMESYEEDASASSRLLTWQTLWNLALDKPIVGAGFDTAQPEIFAKYAPVPMLHYAPHSMYFQALGEHGFVGLGIYLTLLLMTWLRAAYLAGVCRKTPELQWGDLLMRMVQASLMGFMVGGAFLTLLHWDLPYYLMGLVVLMETVVKEHRSALVPKPWVLPSRRVDPPAPELAARAPQFRK